MAAIFYTLASLKAKLESADKERGATAVEYGIMVAFIAIGIILAVTAVRDQLIVLFGQVAAAL